MRNATTTTTATTTTATTTPATTTPETTTATTTPEPTFLTFVPKVTPAGATVYVVPDGRKGTLLLSPAFFPGSVLPASIRIEAIWATPKVAVPVDPAKLMAEIEKTEKRLAALRASAAPIA